MGKARSNSGKNKNTRIPKLKVLVEKLQWILSLGPLKLNCSTSEAANVEQGQFAVMAVHGEEEKRFVVPLSYLTHPNFLKLLEQAAEEYGFNYKGALTVPCHPSELEKILNNEQWPEELK
ncbi:auxin-induced protein 6B-like [Rosa rugosa]|uniref:auxin-induced protein 6B-like n=1 Tax=Rosa rugosa TaxID=74645 RepID=UPI002B40C13D|nr:auxin-induced protein 6B-like [Rosa rugosa]